MYLFDPSLLQIVLAVVFALAAAFLAAWLVAADGGTSGEQGQGAGGRATGGPGEDQEELEIRQKVIIWTAAGAALLFLLWWATLSTGSGGRSML